MEEIIRNVRDLPSDQRLAYESVVGHALRDNQQIVLRVVDACAADSVGTPQADEGASATATLPDWCNVYQGLSDEEIAEVEKIVLQRANLTRNAG